jgi:enoyl-CoA hydratase/carnithine racemase
VTNRSISDTPQAPDEGQVTVEVNGASAVVLLDRPRKHNALTPEMLGQLDAILTGLDADRDVRTVILAGAGTRSFCAGADIMRFKALEPLDMWATWTRVGLRVFEHLARLRQPTIAAVHGNAYGGGLELALACDLRIMSTEATVGLTEVGLGTVPGWGGSGRLREAIGLARAKEMIFTGDPLTAARAADWGLVTHLVAPEAVLAAAHVLAERINRRAPIAVQMAKQSIDSGDAYRFMEPLAAAATAYTQDADEAFTAYRDKRPPRFTGA